MAKRLFALTRGPLAAARSRPRDCRLPGRGEPASRDWRLGIRDRSDSKPDRRTAKSIVALTHAGFGHDGTLGDAPIVLFLGKLTPRKGVTDLVRAFATLDAPAAVLVIAGNDMGAGRSVEALVTNLQLRTRVTFTGLLSGTGTT